MEFVAIDFETANGNANSACQLAIVHVRDSEIIDETSWLLRPPRMYFAPRNIAVHGIRPKQVIDAPTIGEIWGELLKWIDGQIIIAHNARFDINVLIESLAAFDIACPTLEFNCTRTLARCAWPGRSRYGLKPLGDSLGIRFQHHDALEDARCCANIALAVRETVNESQTSDPIVSLESLETLLKIKRGAYRNGQIKSPIAVGRKRSATGFSGRQTTDKWGFPNARKSQIVGSVDAATVVASAADSAPLAGKNIVMLGPLRGLTAEATKKLVCDLGGCYQETITGDTNLVVACGTTLDSASELVNQSAQTAADPNHRPPGQVRGVRLLSERQFRALLPGGKASSW